MKNSVYQSIIAPFQKELKPLFKILKNKNGASSFSALFELHPENSQNRTQSFNFWKASMFCHNYFQLFKKNNRIQIVLLDELCDFVDINSVLIFFTYFFPNVSLKVSKFSDDLFERLDIIKRLSTNSDCYQYDAAAVCKILKNQRLNNQFAIIGLTSRELYYDDSKFVLGQSFCQDRSAVICLGKYFELNQSRTFLSERLLKSLLHESGHLFGLQHCVVYTCLMNASHSLAEAAQHPLTLCPLCLAKVQTLLGFESALRYQTLWQLSNTLQLGPQLLEYHKSLTPILALLDRL